VKEFLQPLFAVVDPQKAADLMKQYRACIFPEYQYSDAVYYKKALKTFENMRKIQMTGFKV